MNIQNVTMFLEKQCFKPTVIVFSNIVGSLIKFVNIIATSMFSSNKDNVNHMLSISLPITVSKFQAEVPLNPYTKSKNLYFKAIGVYL